VGQPLKRVWFVFLSGIGVAGILLLSFRFRQFIFPPPSSYSIAILGVLAVVMTVMLPKEPSKTQKVMWIAAAFFLMFLEMWAVSHDRKEQDAHFVEIVHKLQTSIEQGERGAEKLNTISNYVKQVPGIPAAAARFIIKTAQPDAHIRILYQNRELTEQYLLMGSGSAPGGLLVFNLSQLSLENTGGGITNATSTRLYFSELIGNISTELCWKPFVSDKPSFPVAFECSGPTLSPQERWPLPALGGSIRQSNISVKLIVFYGAKSPEETNFSIHFR
jgi:hypothetical protein